jgi:2-polyprenyl-6-methoxyphenol hydroxylase-like FAD-dependent oxidoreductase
MRNYGGQASGSAVIVGGSLTGLALGIALARIGIEVVLIEQSTGLERGGTGLGVDRSLLFQLVGVDPRSNVALPELPVLQSGRETTTWLAISTWLRALANQTGGLSIHEGTRTKLVTQSADSATAWAADASYRGDIVIGADGYRSLVRATVNPGNPDAAYAGFVLWRALIAEETLPAQLRHADWLGSGIGNVAAAARLVAYYVPGIDGSTDVGKRQITIAWYDADRTSWLKKNGIIDRSTVVKSVEPTEIDDVLRGTLREVANDAWPWPSRQIVLNALDGNLLFGTALAQYWPQRLTSHRVAIVGDAAHVASPMVGHGLALGWLDAIALRDALLKFGYPGPEVLARYNRERLIPSQQHVSRSMDTTNQLLSLFDSAKG